VMHRCHKRWPGCTLPSAGKDLTLLVQRLPTFFTPVPSAANLTLLVQRLPTFFTPVPLAANFHKLYPSYWQNVCN
jgi:hypothetical protein